MRSFHILDIKNFMNLLLLREEFDDFLLQEMEIVTSFQMKISGHRNPLWYGEDELRAFESSGCREFFFWRDMRERVKNEIKGKQTPLLLRGVFLSGQEGIRRLAGQAGLEENSVQTLIQSHHLEIMPRKKSVLLKPFLYMFLEIIIIEYVTLHVYCLRE